MPAVLALPRANEGDFVDALRQQRQLLADIRSRHAGRRRFPQTANLDRRIGLGIEGFEMARSAGQEQKDAGKPTAYGSKGCAAN
jgi:hypothetical protein